MKRRARSLLTILCAAALTALPIGASAAGGKQRFGAAVAPIRLVPTGSQPIQVAGLHSFFGTVELGSFGDGLAVIDDVAFEKYLLGLNEVPVDWPMEALRAQAVAARTYALWTLQRPRAGSAAVYGFDICATVQCQVFSGADVLRLPNGGRWTQAVRSTAGQVVLYRDQPILARYHSTSGGETLDNSQAFPTEQDYPYLQGVSSTTEERAPLYRWKVRFALAQLQAILERAGVWRADFGRLEEVHTRASSSGLHYPDVIFVGRKGRTLRTAEELRDVVRDLAPALFPGEYPSRWRTSSGVLPETFPSNRISIRTRGRVVHVLGRGWGHGVGMSQWGAEGLARRGFDYIDILTHYYTGVTVGRFTAPARIRVGAATGLSTASVTGDFRIIDGTGRTLVPHALGSWTFRYGGSGAVSIDPPAGYGLPLRLGVVKAPRRVEPGRRALIRITLSRPARVSVTARPASRSTPPVVRSAGKTTVAWRAPRTPGTYVLRIRARSESATKSSEPLRLSVERPPEPSPKVAPGEDAPADAPTEAAARTAQSDGDDVGVLGLVALVALLVVAVATGVLAAKIDAWAKQPPQA